VTPQLLVIVRHEFGMEGSEQDLLEMSVLAFSGGIQ
jgi:hypothetical protein